MRQRPLCLFLLLAIGQLASAQIVQLGSIAPSGRSAIRTAMAQGVPPVPKQGNSQASSRFHRADATVAFAKIAAAYATGDAEQKGLVTLFETTLGKYDEAAAESGFGNDMAGALSMLFLLRERLATGVDLPEGSDQKIALQLQAVLDTAAIKNLADREKQAVFEWAISTTAILLTMQQQVAQSGGDPGHKLAAAADELLGDVFGVPGNQLTVGGDGLKATRTATPAPVASGDFVQLAAVSATGHAAVRAALQRGLPQAKAMAKGRAASRFRRAAEPVAVEQIALGYSKQEGAERATIRALFQRMLAGFAARLTDEARRDDFASGIAVLIATRHLLATGSDLEFAVTERIMLQLQAALDTPAVRKLSSADKQAVQEWTLCTTAMLLLRQQQQKEPAAQRRLLAAADELIGSLFAIAGERLGVSTAGLAIAGDAGTPAGTAAAGFAFTTTRFDDGWVATVGQEGVHLQKGDTTVLLHFGVAYTDQTRNLDDEPRMLHFWNTLVSPRYKVASITIRPTPSGYDRVYFGDGNGTEIATGKPVHVAMMITSANGQAMCTEIVTADAAALKAQFPSDEAMRHMADYNKFDVGATDLPGTWEESSSIYSQYYFRDTGNSAGMRGVSTYSKFRFQGDGTYDFEYAGVSDQLGVHTDKKHGQCSIGNWGMTLTEGDGKRTDYHARFEAIRGGRILHLQNKQASGLQYHLLKRE